MLRAGFEMAARMLSFPAPVLTACTGHAVAMGAFLLLSADYRLGAPGPYKITTNEVAIGLTMPRSATEICRHRLSPAYLTRAVMLAEVFAPGDAVAAGFLDRLVPPPELTDAARGSAADLARLDRDAYAATKQRAREPVLTAVRAAIGADCAAWAARAASN
jgi:enoyl-CoA hydratase